MSGTDPSGDLVLTQLEALGLDHEVVACDPELADTTRFCEAYGYSPDDSANASLRLRFYFADGEDRIDCASKADPQYVGEANNKLAKRGYTRPTPPATTASSSSSSSGGSPTGSCTLEQIAAMARAGLSDEKIRAACVEGG